MMHAHGYLYRLWEQGQSHLAAGRYVAARAALEAASDLACRARDVRSLARIYLPLLEARRLIRYRAAEGRIVIAAANPSETRRQFKEFQQAAEGTLLLTGAELDPARTCRRAHAVHAAARRTGRALEALLLFQHGHSLRLAAPHAPAFAAGIPALWTLNPSAPLAASTDPALVIPLPPPGTYDGKAPGLGALARESLLIAWEALALRWQCRHPLAPHAGAWAELLWLRAALRLDPACEPITMRLIALAEGLERRRRH